VERERKIKRAKEREKNEGRLPSFFPALSLALVFARAPQSERLEQANYPGAEFVRTAFQFRKKLF